MKIPGIEARAVGVAFNDFAAQLATFRAESMYGDSDAGEDGGLSSEEIARLKPEWECADSPGTYDVWVYPGDGGTSHIVELWPRWERCYGEGAVVFGGGAQYEIDAKTYEILKKEMWE
jgi:hypothetical protein